MDKTEFLISEREERGRIKKFLRFLLAHSLSGSAFSVISSSVCRCDSVERERER